MPQQAALGVEGFAKATNVSRETLERLRAYAELLVKWNRTINLVSPASLPNLWRRHILDSWQLIRHLGDKPGTIADLGSGAGLPGLILSLLGAGSVHLIESDQRKCVFLREAARITNTEITLHACRVEDMTDLRADVITARALAPLDSLLTLGTRLLAPGGACYFLKGAKASEELEEARAHWRFKSVLFPSLSDETGAVVKLESIEREH